MRTKLISSVLLALCSSLACASLSVIVHPDSPISSLSEKQIKRLFLGQASGTQGVKLFPVEVGLSSEQKRFFYKELYNKNMKSLQKLWSYRIQMGTGSAPPTQLDSMAEVKKLVSFNPNIIGYIDSHLVDDSVKVVFVLD